MKKEEKDTQIGKKLKQKRVSVLSSKVKSLNKNKLLEKEEKEKLEKTEKLAKAEKTEKTEKPKKVKRKRVSKKSVKERILEASTEGEKVIKKMEILQQKKDDIELQNQLNKSEGLTTDKTYIMPLGGLEEIGKNMMAIQYRDEIIVVDCGIAFPDDEHLGIDVIVPSFAYLEANKNKIKALLLTHGHEDHMGSIAYFYEKLGTENIPVYGGKLTLELAKSKFEKKDQTLPITKIIKSRNEMKISKYFTAEFVSVTHSIPDCYGICIKTPTSSMIHTGDYKIDLTPVAGEGFDFARFAELGEQGIDLLMADSTNSQVVGYTPSEKTVGKALDNEIGKATGRIIVAAFASHVHRLQQIINIAEKYNRKIAVDGRSMIKIFEICSRLGYLQIPKGMLIDLIAAEKMKGEEVIVMCTGTQGEPLAALSRIANGNHKFINLRNGDTVLISSTPIPGNEKAAYRNVNQLLKRNANVVFEKVVGIHVSGHAAQEEQKLLFNLVKPKFFMPVHGEYSMMKKYKETAMMTGIPEENILLAENGTRMELTPTTFKIVGKVPAGMTFIDGSTPGYVGDAVLRDRQNLSDDGVVILTVTIDKEGKFGKQIELVTKGFVYNRAATDLLTEAKDVVTLLIKSMEENNITDINKIKQNIRNKVSEYLYGKTNKQPIVIPIIMEL